MKKIVVVVGDAEKRQELVSALTDAGYEVTPFGDPLEAARATSKFHFVVVITEETVVKHHDGLVLAKVARSKGLAGLVLHSELPAEVVMLCQDIINGPKPQSSRDEYRYRIQGLLRQTLEPLTLPEIRQRVIELTADQRDPFRAPDIKQVTDVIQQDPQLTALMIRLANTVLIRGIEQVSSVGVAVGRLGLLRVHAAVMTMAVLDIVKGMAAVPGFDPHQFWRHFIACAVTSEVLFELVRDRLQLDPALASKAFTGGIMHDVGKVILYEHAPELFGDVLKLMRYRDHSMWEAEHGLCGVSHCTVGTRFSQQWRLSAILEMVIKFHHTPDCRNVSESGRIISLVQVADALAWQLGFGVGGDGLTVPALNADILRLLDLKNEEIEALKPVALERIHEMLAVIPL